MRRATLWTRDFTLITIGTVISAIGGTAVRFALGIVIFDNTDSTWLTGVYTAVMMIPSTLIPIISAPLIDSRCRQKILFRFDTLSGFIYLGFFIYLTNREFSYTIYMGFGLITGVIDTIYAQAYNSLYPELIPQGFSQKGYSVSSIIYPATTTLITPVAAYVYTSRGIEVIILAEGILLLTASVFERLITPDRREKRRSGRFSSKGYFSDMLGGIHYLKKEKGIRNIYGYMAALNATANGNNLMFLAQFQSSSSLTTAMYSFLISSETLGRMLGGILHYFIRIPAEKRYKITENVYIIYESLDGVMLLLSFPVMVALRFILGFLGVNTATLRAAAVQKYLPSEVRARVDALVMVLMSLCQMLTGLVAGALGEVLQYPVVTMLFAMVGLVCVYLFIIRNSRLVARIYNADR